MDTQITMAPLGLRGGKGMGQRKAFVALYTSVLLESCTGTKMCLGIISALQKIIF